MVFYKTQMPQGVAANVVRALKLASALADNRNRGILQAMRAPNQQTAQEFVAKLIDLLENCTDVARVCMGPALREQARSTEVKKPRKLAPGLRHKLQHVGINAISGLTLREEEIGSIRSFWAVRAIEAARIQGQWMGRAGTR